MFRYSLKYRPPEASSNLPKGYEVLETPRDRSGYNRPDLPTSDHRFGVIGLTKQLSRDDVERYELTYLGKTV